MKAAQVYRLLRDSGFPAGAAVTMTAIAGAESGWNPAAVGDTALETSTWGPSVGLFQIRTLKAQSGTGGPRDITRLRNNPTAQAAAAHEIWAGSGFGAWSTYNSGAYKGFVSSVDGRRVAPRAPRAQRDASRVATTAGGATIVPAGLGDDLGKAAGGLLNPFNFPGAIGGAAGDAAGTLGDAAAGALWGQIQPFLLTMSFAAAGLALVVIGVTVTARPAVDAATAKVDQVKGEAAKAAQLAAVVA